MRAILVLSVLFSPIIWATDTLNVKQATMLQTLAQVIAVFSEEYAPFDYKIESANYDLLKEAGNARSRIESNPEITTAEFQDVLTDFVSATRDFHVSISFLSTESATLPFQVMGTQGRYFVIYIDRQKLPTGSMPDFEVGSEILEFGGKPVAEAVRDLVPRRFKEPSGSELRLAEIYLTSRERHLGMKVPNGAIMIKIKDSRSNLVRELPFTWEYTPEYVPNDIPVRNMLLPPTKATPVSPALAPPAPKLEFTQPLTISGEVSLVPALGPVLGVSNAKDFSSYLFRLPKGKIVGYVRIPSFKVSDSADHAATFANLIGKYREITDALVIDLTHNGGGSFFYMAALLSHLSSAPLKMLPQRIMVSQRMAATSASRLAYGSFYHSESEMQKWLGTNLDGMEVHFEFFQSLLNNDRFLLSELNAGRRLTNPTYLDGLSFLPPAPVHYDKPVLVLIDELDFSGADFFSAILQDNKRAVLFGQRTAGAGGAVEEISFPNQFGVDQLHYTSTVAQRVDGSPLEGVGVSPDIPYSYTIDDLQGGFVDYKNAVVETLEKMLK